MSNGGSNYSNNATNFVEIYNNTSYNLTFRYSGVESKKNVLSPQQRKSTKLKKGNYRITASVDAANVSNYAANEYLSGRNYTSQYYIKIQTYNIYR